jgi:hypothetical protein
MAVSEADEHEDPVALEQDLAPVLAGGAQDRLSERELRRRRLPLTAADLCQPLFEHALDEQRSGRRLQLDVDGEPDALVLLSLGHGAEG